MPCRLPRLGAGAAPSPGRFCYPACWGLAAWHGAPLAAGVAARGVRLVVLALLALVTTLGTTACNPLYYYYNHGPPTTPATPSGTYTVKVTGQSTNGVSAITNTTTISVTVN